MLIRRPSVRHSQKLSDDFFSFLSCSFLWMVPMHSTTSIQGIPSLAHPHQ